jgi:hypothetical protein
MPARLYPFNAGVPNAMQPALSGDGKWLAFASPGEGGTRPEIWLKPMPKGAAKRVTAGGGANDEPALSPDGHWLAFHSTRQPEGVYLQPAAPSGSGGAARLLAAGGRAPRFSPDGQWIAYLNAGGSSADPVAYNMSMLYCVPAQGGTPVRLARNASSVQGAAWSADSRSVLFLAPDEYSDLRLWSAPLDGTPAWPMTASSASSPAPWIRHQAARGRGRRGAAFPRPADPARPLAGQLPHLGGARQARVPARRTPTPVGAVAVKSCEKISWQAKSVCPTWDRRFRLSTQRSR